MKKILIILPLFILLITTISALNEFVLFNGEWKNGTTLYSEVYLSGNYLIEGTNVYPIRPIIKNCTTETYCSKYNYHYETSCIYYNPFNNRCILYSKNKIIDGCNIYKTRTKCTRIKIGCINPETGVYTNQLPLKSFEYSLDGITWGKMQYYKAIVNNSQIQFRLNIPNICSPEYKINKAIFIKSM